MKVDKLLALAEAVDVANKELEDAMARLAIRYPPKDSKQARRLCELAEEQGITEIPELPSMPPMPVDIEL